MQDNTKIYVAGHRGLVGSALVRVLEAKGCRNVLQRTSAELDLTDQEAVRRFFEQERPDSVFLAAAKVGGILANNTYPAQFIHVNLAIQTNVIHEAWRSGVRRLLFLGSSCIFPRDCPQPMKEEYLLTGPLEPTNRPYAVAKIAGIEMCWAYNREYGTRYLAVMPTNLYGPNDNYDLAGSHVIPAMIRKFHEAKVAGAPHVTLWGTGAPRREFLHVDDLARACVYLMDLPETEYAGLLKEDVAPLLNIGSGEDQTIRELAEMVRETVGYQGDIVWDTGKPDGTPRKLLDVSRMRNLGWKPVLDLQEGLEMTYQDFLATPRLPSSATGAG
ncbi:GDP-L-fucose synthase family protein [Desulfonatronum thioautotrophicum]|uniref:GDP-L-fucose synthase family protein n=1 Tax=Desulfonatronum thioautotrophicum TaxID=617001 RepID=UPI0005EB0583|nr:GDP-L-fucose synthase [Desulfonatronum thioautotrophicum]